MRLLRTAVPPKVNFQLPQNINEQIYADYRLSDIDDIATASSDNNVMNSIDEYKKEYDAAQRPRINIEPFDSNVRWFTMALLPNNLRNPNSGEFELIEKEIHTVEHNAKDISDTVGQPSQIIVENTINDGNHFTLNVSFYLLYGIIITIGAAMNIYVIYRMRRFRKRDREQYRNGIGICLCAMAASDLIALISLLMHFTLASTISVLSENVQKTMCKLILFSTHTAYTQSMWCWLFMSGLRYLATTRPLQYTTLWRLPFTAMSVVLVGAMLENSWLLLTIDATQEGGCRQEFNTLNRIHQLFDISISFVVPTILVLYMDIIVLCRRRKSKQSDPMLQIVINRPHIEPKQMFCRFVIVTLSIIMLNAPENLLRILTIFKVNFNWQDVAETIPILAEVCYLMFFAQFAFNAFYLTTHVYDKSVLSKTNSSRQLSISFRQRLEESSHMIRERSSTVSYRATTPIPPLARNSSCCALDEICPKKHWL